MHMHDKRKDDTMNTRRSAIALTLASMLVLVAAGSAAAQGAKPAAPRAARPAAAKLVITGSSTLAPLIADLARRYQAEHPGTAITVEAGGSGRGVADARAGRADIGMVSRALTLDENKDLFAITLARDSVAFVVHRDNPVRSIAREQVCAILQGKATNWKALGGPDAPIRVLTRSTGHSTLDIVAEYCGIKPGAIAAQRAAGDNPEALQGVLDDAHTFTFISFGFALAAEARGKAIRLLALDGVAANAAELRSGRYPLARQLNLVTKSVPAGAALSFIEYLRSTAVRAAIEEHDFVPYH